MIDELVFAKLTMPVKELQQKCNTEILNVIMRRIKQIKNEPDNSSLAPYDEDLLAIDNIRRSYEDDMRKKMASSILDIAMLSYEDCADLYEDASRYRYSFDKNKKLLDLTQEMITAVVMIYYGLNDNYHAKIRDIKNPNIKLNMPIKQAYEQVINRAKTAKKSNLDFDTVMTGVERDLIENSITVPLSGSLGNGYYKTDSAYESILNQALVETAQRTYDYVKEELTCDGIEISAHLAPAPDHAPCQGHQFTNQNWEFIQSGLDFIDVQGRHYVGFPRQIGTCNCRHLTKPIIIGKTKQTYDDYTLGRILDANERGYNTSDGKHYTFYECTQKLNYFKRQMDKADSGIKLSESVGNDNLKMHYEASYSHYKDLYNSFKKQLDIRLYHNN